MSLGGYGLNPLYITNARKGYFATPRCISFACIVHYFVIAFSSPLGELFDHGLDSSAVWLMVLSNVSCFGLGDHSVMQIDFVFIVYFTLFAFNIAHWEKYTTGVLFLPWAYDISQIVS